MAKASWIFSSTPYYSADEVKAYLSNNPVEFFLSEGQPEFKKYKLNNLETKIVFRKKAGDPRLVRSHTMQLTYPSLPKAGFDVLNNYTRFWGQQIHLKLWQFDAKMDNLSAVLTSNGSVVCWPKGDGTLNEYFAPYRHLADDESDKTHVFVNGTLVEDGYTIDYDDGRIIFSSGNEPVASDLVSMHFVWKPQVVIVSCDPRPVPGKSPGNPMYKPVIILEEV